MKRNHKIPIIPWLLPTFTLLLAGCAGAKPPVPPAPPAAHAAEQVQSMEPAASAIPFSYQVDPEDFSLSIQAADKNLTISSPSERRTVEALEQKGSETSWTYPDEQLAVSVKPVSDYLSVTITSLTEEDHAFTWPVISADTYYLPLGEGKRIPAGDAAWKDYLDGQALTAMEDLSMPFWITPADDCSVLFIMEDPYRTEMRFTADPQLTFQVNHDFSGISANRTERFRIYVTDRQPAQAAKLYKDYVIEQNRFVTLEEKAAKNPDVRKLYGAPFIYLWGDFLLSSEDVNWQEFRKALSDPVMGYLASLADSQENGQEYLDVLKELQGQDYVAVYQKNVICGYISSLLKEDGFWNPSVLKEKTPEMETLLSRGYERLNESEKIQVHKYALAGNLPQVFQDAGSWMDGDTVSLIRELKEAGLDRAWIGLNSWEQAYAKPELTEQAVSEGYLIGSYDSYHSIHEPFKEQWITAHFSDSSLYENASITDKNGEKVSGFKGVGRKLNPALSLPAVKERINRIMKNQLPFNSWFIDCDATGEIYDDYTPEHITPQEQDAASRLERMALIRDEYKLVIGSEGGNDFAASTIAFAHGIELKSFSWMDEDMKSNQESEYYIGRYYNPAGYTAEHFSKQIPVKDEYYPIFLDPGYDFPLFKLVYNDSVITSYHWDWSTFKILGAQQDRMLREVLYNVPPLYHLDSVEWEKYKDAIISHNAVWSAFSQKADTLEMTDFSYLTDDGLVQQTRFGDSLTVTANFRDTACDQETGEIPAHSLLIREGEEETVYTP